MSSVDQHPRLLTLEEAGRRLRISVVTIRRRIRDGDLPAVRLGPTDRYPLRIDERQLDEWLQQVPAERRAPDVSPAVEARQHGGKAGA